MLITENDKKVDTQMPSSSFFFHPDFSPLFQQMIIANAILVGFKLKVLAWINFLKKFSENLEWLESHLEVNSNEMETKAGDQSHG